MVPLRLWIRCGNPKAESFFRVVVGRTCYIGNQACLLPINTAPSSSRQDQRERESVQYDGMHTSNSAATTPAVPRKLVERGHRQSARGGAVGGGFLVRDRP